VLEDGFRTVDIYTDGMKKVGTAEMGTEIANRI
jgi:3-isopropylmalate dehydrogenase